MWVTDGFKPYICRKRYSTRAPDYPPPSQLHEAQRHVLFSDEIGFLTVAEKLSAYLKQASESPRCKILLDDNPTPKNKPAYRNVLGRKQARY